MPELLQRIPHTSRAQASVCVLVSMTLCSPKVVANGGRLNIHSALKMGSEHRLPNRPLVSEEGSNSHHPAIYPLARHGHVQLTLSYDSTLGPILLTN